MSADALLARLDRARRTGDNRWVARCPAHDDKGPSLSVRELDDGRVLLHCFAGCATGDVLDAVGLSFDALFPERAVGDHAPRERRPFSATDALRCCASETLVVAVIASDLARGAAMTTALRDRLWLAADRLRTAVEGAT